MPDGPATGPRSFAAPARKPGGRRRRLRIILSVLGGLVVLVGVLWALLLGVLGLLAVAAHPALHVRTPATMSEDDRAAARQEVRRAIRRMDLLLRLELTLALIALLAGVLLRTTT